MTEVVDAPQHQEFLLEKRKIHNIKELYDALDSMTDKVFAHFVSKDHNHFASWIEHSLNSKFLAARVRRCKNRAELKKALFMELFM
ncbi:hypothetical protein GOV11_00650 [Candidatus Woesearchaeota archaeon]|nr:hypothetical protein [Candidatus Woesearchaeota archaeon]